VSTVSNGRVGGPLSNPFKVAAEVYKITEVNGGRAWYGKLVENLDGIMSSSTVRNSINDLITWGILKVQYGRTEKGRAGRLLFISGESRDVIKSVYETYWQ